MSQDLYDILGVSKSASDAEIKSSYKKLAKKHHPDRNQGDKKSEQKFKEISEAYEVLSDKQKRHAYDHGAFDPSSGGAGHQGFDFSDAMNSFFGDMMGGGRQSTGKRSQRGADLKVALSITLEEAFHGISMQITLPSMIKCSSCSGAGSKSGSIATCHYCGGAGQTASQNGIFFMQQTCRGCQGSGRIVKDPCKNCNGKGAFNGEKSIKVDIPAGVTHGSTVPIAGEGNAGELGGPSGDLYLVIDMKPHTLFKHQGADLYIDVPVSVWTAILGGEEEIVNIEGKKLTVAVPKGMQNGKVVRLRSQGMRTSGRSMSGRGHLYVKFTIEIPTNLNSEQEELVRKCAMVSESKNNPKSEGFFAKIKNALSNKKAQ